MNILVACSSAEIYNDLADSYRAFVEDKIPNPKFRHASISFLINPIISELRGYNFTFVAFDRGLLNNANFRQIYDELDGQTRINNGKVLLYGEYPKGTN